MRLAPAPGKAGNPFQTSSRSLSSRNSRLAALPHRDSSEPAKWVYDNPAFRQAFNSGQFSVNMDRAVAGFFNWLSTDYLLTFENKVTGETFKTIGPKRGNKPYARRKWQKVNGINEGMDKLRFDFDIAGHRPIVKNCHMLLITTTFDQKVSMDEAWFSISSHGGELNKFRANLTKIFGSKATICVKEAQSNGYPAPHILVLLDRPIRVRRHAGRKKTSWRLESKDTLKRVKGAWKWGFVDVEAVVMASSGKYRGYRTPVNYLSKYLTKHMDLTKYPELQTVRGIEDVPKELRTPVYTHVWNKILRSRDFFVSKAFKQRLNNPEFRPAPIADEATESDWFLESIEMGNGLERALAAQRARGGGAATDSSLKLPAG
jgi:hypothetical protein